MLRCGGTNDAPEEPPEEEDNSVEEVRDQELPEDAGLHAQAFDRGAAGEAGLIAL